MDSTSTQSFPQIRAAEKADVDALVRLEEACFEGDRLSRRNFIGLLTRAKAALMVAGRSGEIEGYILVLFHKGTSLARVYSVAVAPAARGAGLGRALLLAAEGEAAKRDCLFLRLEVRVDNVAAARLYESLGYRRFATWHNYYEDSASALRFEKRLAVEAPSSRMRVPFYAQTTTFTCGPAALMMGMAALQPETAFAPRDELQVWREATTIFMTSGHGGCGPRGLALAAHARGFEVAIYLSREGPLFLDGVRSEDKKRILQRVHEDFCERVDEAGIPLHLGPLPPQRLAAFLDAGAVPLTLISSYRLYGEKSPHWVVVTGMNERFVFFNDPAVDRDSGESETDHMNVPIRLDEFAKMARFGSNQLQATVVLSKRP